MSTIYTDKPGDHPYLYSFLAEKTSLPWSTDLRVIGTMRGLAPSAAVGYNGWVGNGVFMHVAFESAHALTRDLLREAFVYPFITLKKEVVYGMTPITNEEAIRFNKKLGFREVYRTSDFVLFVMTLEECRWLNGRQKFSSPGS
jgi:L-amino acid N-acyltransferase YncA